jgi:hypothetical protein
MSVTLRLVAALTALLMAVVLGSIPASAAPGGGGGQGSGGRTGDVITAGVAYRSGGAAAGGSGSVCSWELVDGPVGVNGYSATWPYTEGGVTYHLWRRTCPDGVAWLQFAETTPQDLLPGILGQLRDRTLPKPVPVFELLDPEFGWAYVRTPLDFRSGADSWRPVSVTASVGPVWATVSARPDTLTFDPGDSLGPGTVVCRGSDPVAPYVAEQPGRCSYTYVNASSTSTVDGYHFATSLAIGWTLSWTSSTGAGGALEPYTTSASALLAVAEVKGLVTCTGSRPEQGGC